jgi:hypothetical protein
MGPCDVKELVTPCIAHGARQRGDGVVKCNGTARERLAGATRRASFGRRVEQIDKKLLEHDVVLQDVVEKLLPLLNPPPDMGRTQPSPEATAGRSPMPRRTTDNPEMRP